MVRNTNRSTETRTTAGLRRQLLQLAVLLFVVAGSFGVAHTQSRLAAACCDNAISSVSGSPNPATTADTVTVTAQVCETTGNGYSPGGYVTLSDTSANPEVVLGTPALVSSGPGCSTATLTTTSLSIGDHVIKLVAYPTATDTGGAPLNGGTDRTYTQTVTAPSSGGGQPIIIGSNTAPTAIGCIHCDGKARFLAPGRDGYVGVGAAAMPVAATAEPGGTLKNLSITINSADAGVWSFSVLVNQAGTSLGCTLAPGALTCVDASLAHVVTINSGDTVELAIGNSGAAPSASNFSVNWTLELDPEAGTPPAPVITAPVSGATSSTNAVLLSGTGVVGGAVTIIDGGTQIGSATVDGTGNFSTTVTLGAGLHTLTARQTVGGHLSPLSNAVSITGPRASPTIATALSKTSVTAGQTAFDSATLTGATSEAGGTVTYTVYTDNLCATQYSSAGAKTVTNGVVPSSDSVTFNSAGTRYWRAMYSGDAGNTPVSSGCTDEPITVTPAVAATPCAAPATGLVSCYAAEGNADDSADSNNGTLQGSATFGSGKVGTQAFKLPDSTAFVSIGDKANLRFTNGITVTAWVNPSQAPVTCGAYPYYGAIVTKWDQNAGNNPASDSYGLWLCTSGASSNVFSAIHLGSGSGLSEPSLQGGSVPNNAWSHVAMTYDGASGQYSIYVNGVQVGTATAPGSLYPTSASVLIGHEASYLMRPFVGSIDDVRLYSRALSLSEIQTLAGVQPVAPAPPTLTAPATGLVTNQAKVTVAGTGVAGASVAIFDGTASAGTTTIDATGHFSTSVSLAEGDHSLTATQTVSGLTSTSSNIVTVTVDTTAPVISIAGVSDGQFSTAPALSPSFSEADAHPGPVTATLDGTPFISGNAVSSEGSHTLIVSAQDAAGNSESATVHFTIDRTPPAISITGVSDGSAYRTAVTVTYVVTDANLGPVSATLDGSAFNSGSTVSTDGLHTLSVTATDLAGNTASASVRFTIDTAPPLLAVQAPANNSYVNSQAVPVSVAASDAGSGLATVTANGVALVAGAGGTFSGAVPLAEGANTIAVDAADRAGNHAQQSVSVTLDTHPPALQVSTPQDGARIAALSTAVSGSAQDTNLATVSVNGQFVSPASDGSFSTAVTLLAGPNTLTVVATDRAGNTTTVTRSVQANATPPSLSISAPQAGLITSAASVSVTGTATPGDGSDPAQLTLTVAGASVAVDHAGSFAASVPLAQEGPNTIQLTVTDSFGLSSSASVNVVRDTAPPVISVTGVTDGQYSNAASLAPAFGATDPHLGTVTATLDGASFSSGAPVSTEGQHVLVVTAQDAAGNVATTTLHFTVDTTPPVISITGVTDGKLYGAAVTPSFIATDTNLAAVSATLDGGVFAAGTAVSANGAHTLVVTATDLAHNSASRTVQFAINTTPPLLKLPADITIEATSPVGAAVPFAATASDAVDGALTLFCVPIAGATFLLGTTTVVCSATNSAGNTATGSFKVVVQDTTPPVISGTPSIVTAEATSSAGASVAYVGPTASDLVDGAVAVACSPAPGSNFGLGTATVTCTAKDSRNNTATATFKVTVQDTTAPTFTVPANQSVAATSPTGAIVTYPIPIASDAVDQHPSVDCVPASGSQFPVGVSSASCTAKDAAGNFSAVQSFTITVTDPAPVVTPPADITAEATSHAGAVVTFVVTPATDVADGTDPVSCSPVSGSTFAPGTATVSCSATNLAGKLGTATFAVTVRDTTPPKLTLPADITAEATSPAGATVTFAASATDLVDGSVTVTCAPAAGATFALSTTTVNCSAKDAAGNNATGSFTVTVADTTPPTISSTPGNITTPATGSSGAVVTYTNPTATDLVGGTLTVICAPPSGSTFAVGVTNVTCSALDPAGNKASSSFTVTVQAGPPLITAPADGSRTKTTAVTVSGTGIKGATIAILDAGASVGTATVDGTGHFSTSVTLSADAHSLKATQTLAGVTSAASSAVSVFVDTTVPDTAITATPRVLENRGLASFTFNAATDPDDTVFTFECSIDAGSFAACASPKTYNGLADGSHTFKVRAIDAAGNVDPTPGAFTWTVDSTPPTVVVTSVDAPADGFLPAAVGVKLPATVGAGPVTVHGTASDTSGIASVVVNGIAATVAADGSWTALKVPVNPGANAIAANATDKAGNAAQVLPAPIVTLNLDLDGDGIANNIDGDCTVRPAKAQPTTGSTRFCDQLLGGRTSGSIVSRQPGMTVTITDATPNPTKGVTVKVTGSRLQRARIRLDRKAVTVALAPGTYILTDPTFTTTVEASDGGTAEFEFTLNGSPVVVSIPDGASASITETQDAAGNLVGAQVTPIAGTVTINGVPVNPGQILTFGKLDAKLDLGSDGFQLKGTFTPGSGSNGVSPAAERVALQIGSVSIVIPAGSFKAEKDKDDRSQSFTFEGTINGIKLEVTLKASGGKWEIAAEGHGAKLAGATSPIAVTVAIGDDAATTQVTLKGDE